MLPLQMLALPATASVSLEPHTSTECLDKPLYLRSPIAPISFRAQAGGEVGEKNQYLLLMKFSHTDFNEGPNLHLKVTKG